MSPGERYSVTLAAGCAVKRYRSYSRAGAVSRVSFSVLSGRRPTPDAVRP